MCVDFYKEFETREELNAFLADEGYRVVYDLIYYTDSETTDRGEIATRDEVTGYTIFHEQAGRRINKPVWTLGEFTLYYYNDSSPSVFDHSGWYETDPETTKADLAAWQGYADDCGVLGYGM